MAAHPSRHSGDSDNGDDTPLHHQRARAGATRGEWELIDGELIRVNPTSLKASMTAHRIGRIIGNFVDQHDLGVVIGADGGYVLFSDRETLLAPDVGFIRRERVPPEDDQHRIARLAPDLAIDVFSPSDRVAAALGKISLHLEAGVQAVWLVDPIKRTVTNFVEVDATLRHDEEDTLTGGRIRPGFSIRDADLIG